MSFLDWVNDPDVAEEIRDIRRHLRCSQAEAVLIPMLANLGEQIESLGTEIGVSQLEGLDDDEDEPLGISR